MTPRQPTRVTINVSKPDPCEAELRRRMAKQGNKPSRFSIIAWFTLTAILAAAWTFALAAIQADSPTHWSLLTILWLFGVMCAGVASGLLTGNLTTEVP